MSFGLGIGDFIAVAQLAERLHKEVYMVARKAPGDVQELCKELSSLSSTLRVLNEELEDPNSLLNTSTTARLDALRDMKENIVDNLKELGTFATRHGLLINKSTGRSIVQRGIDRMKYVKDAGTITGLRAKLHYHCNILHLLLTSVGNKSLEKLQADTVALNQNVELIKAMIKTAVNQDATQNITNVKNIPGPPLVGALSEVGSSFQHSVSAKFLNNAETIKNRTWMEVGLDDWLTVGEVWMNLGRFETKVLRALKKSPLASAMERQHYHIKAFVNLLKASWILNDVVRQHPQRPYVSHGHRQASIGALAASVNAGLADLKNLHEQPLCPRALIDEGDYRVFSLPQYSDFGGFEGHLKTSEQLNCFEIGTNIVQLAGKCKFMPSTAHANANKEFPAEELPDAIMTLHEDVEHQTITLHIEAATGTHWSYLHDLRHFDFDSDFPSELYDSTILKWREETSCKASSGILVIGARSYCGARTMRMGFGNETHSHTGVLEFKSSGDTQSSFDFYQYLCNLRIYTLLTCCCKLLCQLSASPWTKDMLKAVPETQLLKDEEKYQCRGLAQLTLPDYEAMIESLQLYEKLYAHFRTISKRLSETEPSSLERNSLLPIHSQLQAFLSDKAIWETQYVGAYQRYPARGTEKTDSKCRLVGNLHSGLEQDESPCELCCLSKIMRARKFYPTTRTISFLVPIWGYDDNRLAQERIFRRYLLHVAYAAGLEPGETETQVVERYLDFYTALKSWHDIYAPDQACAEEILSGCKWLALWQFFDEVVDQDTELRASLYWLNAFIEAVVVWPHIFSPWSIASNKNPDLRFLEKIRKHLPQRIAIEQQLLRLTNKERRSKESSIMSPSTLNLNSDNEGRI